MAEDSNVDSQPPETQQSAAGQSDKANTQHRILTAAMELFLRRGYSRTSVTQIAKKANVSRAAVFWHFSDKENLFREAAKQFVVPFRNAIGSHLTHLEPRKRLFELISIYERFVEQNRPNIEAFVTWVLESPEHSGPIREELLTLHDAFRTEMAGVLAGLLGNEKQATFYANGLISLLDGNVMLSIFGANTEAQERQRTGLRAVTELILKSKDSA